MAAELHAVVHLGARKLPRVAVGEPVVRHLDLAAVHDRLLEHAVVVANAVAKAGNIQRGHGIQKASGQAAQATVAQSSVGLQLGHRVDVYAKVGQSLFDALAQAHGEHGVTEGAANQKLHAEVVHALGVLGVLGAGGGHPALDQLVAHGVGGGVQPVFGARGLRVFADYEHEFVRNGALERLQIAPGRIKLKTGRGGSGCRLGHGVCVWR